MIENISAAAHHAESTTAKCHSFVKLMQDYYSQPVEELMKDARPDAAYQVGVTPENVECAKCAKDPACLEMIDSMPEQNRPHKPQTAVMLHHFRVYFRQLAELHHMQRCAAGSKMAVLSGTLVKLFW